MSELKNDYIKSMDYCQSAIQRMASNSFKLKSWFLAAFTALFTFFAKSDTKVIADLVWLLPLLTFIYLDAFYLRHERIFVGVFAEFGKQVNDTAITTRKPYDLRPSQKLKDNFSVLNVVFSTSVGWFYFPLLTAFESLIIFHTLGKSDYWMMLIFPVVTLIASCFLKKQTAHQ